MVNRDELAKIYTETKSYTETAKYFGVSRQRIYQLINGFERKAASKRTDAYRKRRIAKDPVYRAKISAKGKAWREKHPGYMSQYWHNVAKPKK